MGDVVHGSRVGRAEADRGQIESTLVGLGKDLRLRLSAGQELGSSLYLAPTKMPNLPSVRQTLWPQIHKKRRKVNT